MFDIRDQLTIPISLTALAFYDALLTFEDERRFIWRRKLTIASITFITSRLTIAIMAVTLSLASDTKTVRRCEMDMTPQRLWVHTSTQRT